MSACIREAYYNCANKSEAYGFRLKRCAWQILSSWLFFLLASRSEAAKILAFCYLSKRKYNLCVCITGIHSRCVMIPVRLTYQTERLFNCLFCYYVLKRFLQSAEYLKSTSLIFQTKTQEVQIIENVFEKKRWFEVGNKYIDQT